MLSQPIPYQGSKRRLAEAILAYFPPSIGRLVEPFAGSAALSLAVASRRQAQSYWLNDANPAIVQLWDAILRNPDHLADRYESLWYEQLGREKAYFATVRARFNHSPEAADFLYLLARCVKAAVRYNARGEFNNTADNRRKGARPRIMRQRLREAASLLQGQTIATSWDYTAVLAACTPSDFVYLDPPYQGVCGNRDGRYFSAIDHDRLCQELESLTARKIPFAVSYDGRTGDKVYGEPLPASLGLTCIELEAGRSSQATLLGRTAHTVESLYLSGLIAGSNADTPRRDDQAHLWYGEHGGTHGPAFAGIAETASACHLKTATHGD